ncbi:MAG: energy transducer TonB [bacterium]
MIQNKGRFSVFSSEGGEESSMNRETREYFTELVKSKKLVRSKNPEANLKAHYKRTFEAAFAITLILLITVVQIGRNISLTASTIDKVDISIEVADIPQTQQFRKPPPPVRPSLPIPTDEESVPEDLTIASTDLDFSDIPAPPAPPSEDDDMEIFVAYDEAPEIIGGLAELARHLRYPRLAQAANIEGIVFVKVLVSKDGRSERAEILKAKPAKMGFEESAIKAIMKIKWHPAKQRDRSIRVWVSIPVQFKLIS